MTGRGRSQDLNQDKRQTKHAKLQFNISFSSLFPAVRDSTLWNVTLIKTCTEVKNEINDTHFLNHPIAGRRCMISDLGNGFNSVLRLCLCDRLIFLFFCFFQSKYEVLFDSVVNIESSIRKSTIMAILLQKSNRKRTKGVHTTTYWKCHQNPKSF